MSIISAYSNFNLNLDYKSEVTVSCGVLWWLPYPACGVLQTMNAKVAILHPQLGTGSLQPEE